MIVYLFGRARASPVRTDTTWPRLGSSSDQSTARLVYNVECRRGGLNRQLLEWMLPKIQEYAGPNPKDGLLAGVAGLLGRSDADLGKAAARSCAPSKPNVAGLNARGDDRRFPTSPALIFYHPSITCRPRDSSAEEEAGYRERVKDRSFTGRHPPTNPRTPVPGHSVQRHAGMQTPGATRSRRHGAGAGRSWGRSASCG
jgi:hypothetical protein